jgi:hypothetical protein
MVADLAKNRVALLGHAHDGHPALTDLSRIL